MATRRIETTIALDGEQAFKKGLAAAAREMRVLESESKALAASFGTSGDAAAAAAAKQRNLQNQVAQQEQIVSALEQAVKDAAKAYGESSAEVDGYAIKLNNARTRLANLQKALTSSDREVEELGRDAIKAGRQIEEGIGDGAREAENELTDLMATMQDSLSAIQSNTAVTAIKTVWDTATGAFNAIDGFVTGTTDYRRQLSFLIQNAGEMDFGLDETEDMLVKTQTITADASAAIEGLSNLFRVEGMDEYKLNRVMENLLGASITWPNTMNFESLAESFQETLATGQAVGQYGELLERLGVDLETFNKTLKDSPTPEGDLEEAIAYMTSNELIDAYNKYKEDNSELIKEMETIARLEFQSARIGGILAKNITTPLKDEFSNVLDWIADTLEEWEKNGFDGVVKKMKEDLVTAGTEGMKEQGRTQEEIDAAAAMLRGEAGNKEFMTLLKARLPMFFPKTREPEYEGFEKELDFSKPDSPPLAVIGERSIDKVLAGIDREAYYKDLNEKEAAAFEQAQREWFEMNEEAAAEAGSEAGQQFTQGFEEWLDPTTWGEGKEVTSLQVIGQRSMDDVLAGIDLDAYYKEMNGAGKEGGAELMEGLEEGSEGAATAGMAAGAAFGGAFAAGLTSQVSYVAASAGALAAAAAAAARAVSAPSMAVGGGVNLALNIDGKTFARATAPYMSGELAVDAR